MSNLGYREIFDLGALSLKQLNDTLRTLWKKVMGGIDYRDLSGTARSVIDAKADQSGLTELETRIVQQADLIALKATKTELDELGGRVGAAETSLTIKADIAQLTSAAENLQSQITAVPGQISLAVGAIKVGGAQMLANSDFYHGLTGWATLTANPSVDEGTRFGGCSSLKISVSGAASTLNSQARQDFPTNSGWRAEESVTLSAWAMSLTPAGLDDGGALVELGFYNGSAWTWQSASIGPGNLTAGQWARFTATATVPAGTMTVRADLQLRRNGTVWFAQPKLEAGSLATSWSLSPLDSAKTVVNRSSLELTPERTKLITPQLLIGVPKLDGMGLPTEELKMQIDDMGVYAGTITSPSVAPRWPGGASLWVNPGGGGDFRSLQEALHAIAGVMLPDNLTIHIASGAALYERVSVAGLYGRGEVTINGNGATIHGALSITNANIAVTINSLNVTYQLPPSGDGSAMRVAAAASVWLNGCTLSGSGTSGSVLEAMRGARVTLQNCALYNGRYLMRAGEGAHVGAINAHGSSNNPAAYNSLYASFGGMICGAGTVPAGSVLTTDNGQIWHAGTTQSAGTPPGGPAALTTVSYPATDSGWYQTAWSQSETNIRQGYTGNGEITGAMWFANAAIRAALAGRTIHSAKLRLKRNSGTGPSSAVSVYLRGLTNAGKSGTPARSGDYGAIASMLQDSVQTADIPVAAVTALVNGSINALALYAADGSVISGRTYSRNYGLFAGYLDGNGPVLTVTYS